MTLKEAKIQEQIMHAEAILNYLKDEISKAANSPEEEFFEQLPAIIKSKFDGTDALLQFLIGNAANISCVEARRYQKAVTWRERLLSLHGVGEATADQAMAVFSKVLNTPI